VKGEMKKNGRHDHQTNGDHYQNKLGHVVVAVFAKTLCGGCGGGCGCCCGCCGCWLSNQSQRF